MGLVACRNGPAQESKRVQDVSVDRGEARHGGVPVGPHVQIWNPLNEDRADFW
jgi:hypothetical protein